jgi:hypothetical protein
MSRSSIRRVLVAAVAGATAVAALTLVGTGTASAAEPTAAMFSAVTAQSASGLVAAGVPGEFGIFDASDFQAGFSDLTNSTLADLTPLNLNDKISSAVNNSDTKMCLFTDANFKGQRIEFPPHTQIRQFPVNLDNAVSSVKPC